MVSQSPKWCYSSPNGLNGLYIRGYYNYLPTGAILQVGAHFVTQTCEISGYDFLIEFASCRSVSMGVNIALAGISQREKVWLRQVALAYRIHV